MLELRIIKRSHTSANIFAIGMVLFAMVCSGAMPRLDSSQFAFKYEMEESPCEQDLDDNNCADFSVTIGNNNSVMTFQDGYAELSGMSGNAMLLSSENDSAWQKYGVTEETGFTVEARILVSDHRSGVANAFCLTASPNSKNHALLSFSTTWVKWGDAVLTNVNLSAKFHTFRIAKEAGNSSTYSVWCDGNLIGSGLKDGNPWTDRKLNRVGVGLVGADWRGIGCASYLRFTKGGYAPPNEKDKRRDSSAFEVKYEMDELPSSFVKTGTVETDSNGGVTTFTFSAASGGHNYQDSHWVDSFWTSARSYGYTMEIRAKVVNTKSDMGIGVWTADNAKNDALLRFKESCLEWSNISGTVITNMDTTADFHVYRLAKIPDENQFILWCDGNLVSDSLTDGYSSSTILNRFLFGRPGSNYDGKIDVDYIRYTSGVWSPSVPPPAFKIILR